MNRGRAGAARPGSLTRRGLLRRMAGAGLAGCAIGMGGCQVQTTSDGLGVTDAGDIVIPDPAGTLPSGEVSIQWLSGGPGAKSEVFNRLFPAYAEKHPNLAVEYDELPNDKIAEALPLQARNNNLPDVFQLLGVPIGELVSGGKLAALDDVVPDFDAWIEAMPFGINVAGRNQFDGKTYSLQTDTTRRCNMLLFNTELMQAAELDPAAEPMTLEAFRQAAKKVTELGNGTSYGLMIGGKGGGFTAALTEMTMLAGGPPVFDWSTGRYANNDDTRVEVYELLKAMLSDGSFFPGWASLGDQESRAQMPLGRAGMILNGPWNFPVWAKTAPDFSYGISALPAPAERGFITVGLGGNSYAVAATASDDNRAVAGDLLHFLGSEAGQQVWARYDGSADPAWSASAIKTIRDSGTLPASDATAFALYDELVRIGPDPVIKNPQQEKVALELRTVTPSLGDIGLGYLLGDVTDLRRELQKLDDASDQELDRAIAAARQKGAEVSRDDRTFANWSATQDFTENDYR